MAELKIGDVVQLKSGGPVMTVRHLGAESNNGKVICTYFHEGKFHGLDSAIWFPENILNKMELDRGQWVQKR